MLVGGADRAGATSLAHLETEKAVRRPETNSGSIDRRGALRMKTWLTPPIVLPVAFVLFLVVYVLI
jgi:hypothetical protein